MTPERFDQLPNQAMVLTPDGRYVRWADIEPELTRLRSLEQAFCQLVLSCPSSALLAAYAAAPLQEPAP